MNTKPKVMHIITRLDMGGSAQNTLLTCLGQADRYDVVLVHGRSHESHMTALEKKKVESHVDAARHKGVKIIPVATLIRAVDPLKDFQTLISLCKLMRQEKPAIVHTHTSKAGILGRLAAKISAVAVIIHTPHGHVFYGHFNRLMSRLFLLVERLFDRITDGVVALTDGEKNDYVQLRVYQAGKMVSIHSGVDLQRFSDVRTNATEIKKNLGLKPNTVVVGAVGWLLPIKGPLYLLRAMENLWREFSETHLVYVGKGELERQLKSEAFRMGVTNKVHFLGWRDDVHEIMRTFDIFVLPSLNEGMGRVLVEAMAAGKAVVASNVGGVPDLVKHGQNGFLVKPGNITDLSYYIKCLLKDQKLRLKMGLSGQRLSQNFSVKKMVEKIDALYLTLLQKKKCVIIRLNIEGQK